MANDKPRIEEPMRGDSATDDETPVVYSVAREGAQWSLTRRSFMTAAAAATAAAGTTACGGKDEEAVIYQQRVNGMWESHVVEPGASIPADAVCVCNTVNIASGQPGQPEPTPTPVYPSVPTSYPSGTRSHSTPTPTPVPTPTPCSCNSYSGCSCNSNSGCSVIVTYWYPN
jgi:hypothetical protein